MENVCSLFFELSNEGRLSIMLELEKEPLKLTIGVPSPAIEAE
jgi:hypothetical protein